MKHRMFILNREGETLVEFDPAVEAEVLAAREHFEAMTGWEHRYAAFKGTPEETPEQITEFDPTAEETTFVPAICGGAHLGDIPGDGR